MRQRGEKRMRQEERRRERDRGEVLGEETEGKRQTGETKDQNMYKGGKEERKKGIYRGETIESDEGEK